MSVRLSAARPIQLPDDTAAPRSGWALTAAESYVLRYAPVTPVGAEVLQLALRELVIRDALRLMRVRTPLALGLRRRRWMVCGGPRGSAVTESVLLPILTLLGALPEEVHPRAGATGTGRGALMHDLARATWRAFGGPAGYVSAHVAPALEARGLLEIHPGAGRRGGTAYAYTAAGERMDAAFDARLERIRRERRSGKRLRLPPDAMAAILILDYQHPGWDLRRQLADPAYAPAGAQVDFGALDDLGNAFLPFDGALGFGGGDGGGGGGDGGGGGG